MTLTANDLAATFDAFNRHDIDGVMQHFADDCVFYAVGGPEVFGTKIEGAADIANAFSAVWAGMTGAHWDHHSHFVHGDRVEAEGADLFTLRDGTIIVKQALRKNRPTFKP